MESLMKEVYKLTSVVKKMEVKLNVKIVGIKNDDRRELGIL